MTGKLFSVYDSQSMLWHPPFTMASQAQAVRAFQQTSLDQRTEICKYPAAFTLFEVGTFDDNTCKITSHEAKINLGTALEHQAKAKEAQL